MRSLAHAIILTFGVPFTLWLTYTTAVELAFALHLLGETLK